MKQRQNISPPSQTEGWGAGVVICLERGADLHMAQLMPLPLTVSYFDKIQINFTFLVPAHPGSPGQRAVKRVCVAVGWMVYLCGSTRCSCPWCCRRSSSRHAADRRAVSAAGTWRDRTARAPAASRSHTPDSALTTTTACCVLCYL